MEIISLFIGTILLRPYVFLFLITYLVAASCHMGRLRAVIFLILGYLIAWISEFSSIHTGFPYGMYKYLPETTNKELWIMGVPFMDSISYVFLSYAAFTVARITMGYFYKKNSGEIIFSPYCSSYVIPALFGAIMFTFLDVIIDPIALQGDKWFLGKIYEYPNGGIYFGVPISNFLGWLFVGFIMTSLLLKLDRKKPTKIKRIKDFIALFAGPLLYVSVILFNLAVTAVFGQKLLFTVDIILVIMVTILITLWIWNKHQFMAASSQCDRFENP